MKPIKRASTSSTRRVEVLLLDWWMDGSSATIIIGRISDLRIGNAGIWSNRKMRFQLWKKGPWCPCSRSLGQHAHLVSSWNYLHTPMRRSSRFMFSRKLSLMTRNDTVDVVPSHRILFSFSILRLDVKMHHDIIRSVTFLTLSSNDLASIDGTVGRS
jgi:hypothetical protein